MTQQELYVALRDVVEALSEEELILGAGGLPRLVMERLTARGFDLDKVTVEESDTGRLKIGAALAKTNVAATVIVPE